MTNLSDREREFLIEKIQKGEGLPEDFKYKLFPTIQKEYELVYAGKMRKEDILADEDGVSAVPLQIEKNYNGERESYEDGWRNMIVFGDNLQFLKTIYKNEDPLIKDKVKGKVKLIYIDPPFATESDFSGNQGQKAYTDKAKDAEFVEFLRRRLVVAREILADDGSIMVHLDYKKVHYIKVLMDEIFGEKNLRNEIIWQRTTNTGSSKALARKFSSDTDTILYYSKTSTFQFNKLFREYSEKYLKRFKYKDKNGYYRWSALKTYSQKKYEQLVKEDKVRQGKNSKYPEVKQYLDKSKGVPMNNLWADINHVNPMAKEKVGYPTQKPERLIQRIIEATTKQGDIVLDFFAGSGTTAAVSEKLNRKWIVSDIGKFSFYTIQKRILTLHETNSLIEPEKQYSAQSKSFVTVNTGFYDIEKLFKLKQEEYTNFVLNLFEVSLKIYNFWC